MKNTQRKTVKSYITLKQRITAAVTAVVMLTQICIPTVALATTAWSGNFESRLANELNSPMIELINDLAAAEAYTGAYFIHKNTINHTTLDSFYNDYKKGKPAQKPQFIGDSFVQSRLIRAQYRSLMGRYFFSGVLRSEETEAFETNRLYGNAKTYAEESNLTLGNPLGNASPAQDMIWPELKQINGKSYLVPVVHLSQDTLNNKLSDHLIQFDANATFAGIQLDFATLITGYNSVVTGLYGIINNQSSIKSPGNLTLSGCEKTPQISDPYSTSILGNIHCSGTIANLGGTIDVAGTLNVYAKDVINKTLVVPYKDKNGEGTRLGRVAEIKAGDIQIFADGNIDFVGASAISEGRFFLNAANDINIRPAQTGGTSQSQEGHWKVNKSTTDLLMSRLAAEDTLSLIAGGVINITASELISSRGGIELLAKQGIYVLNEFNQTQVQKVDKIGKTKGTSSDFQTFAIRSVINSGKGLLLYTETGDITLTGTKINAVGGTNVTALNGKIKLLVAKEQSQHYLNTVRKGTWTVKTVTEEYIEDRGVPNAITGGFAVNAAHGVEVEYTGIDLKKNPNATLADQITEYEKMPEMAWMATLYKDPKVQAKWSEIELEYKRMRDTNTTLSPAAMAIIAIVCAVATGGSSLALTNGATVFGASGAWAGVANAAFTTMVTQTAQSVALGKSPTEVLRDLTSSENLKSLAISMATAGAMQYADLPVLDQYMASENIAVSLTAQATQAVINATVSTGISVTINGGNSSDYWNTFKVSLATSAINKIGEKMANKIGIAFRNDDINNVVRYIAHAGAGCVLGLASGSVSNNNDEQLTCLSGAGGAVVGELVADSYKEAQVEALFEDQKAEYEKLKAENKSPEEIYKALTSPERHDFYNKRIDEIRAAGVDLAKLSGGFAALVGNGDVNIAAMTAENAAKNNALFLLPLAIMAIKAIDLALTAGDIWKIYLAYQSGGGAAVALPLLEEFLGEKLIGKAVPGFRTAEELLEWMKKNDYLSNEMASAIKKIFDENHGKPGTEGNSNFVSLDISGKREISVAAGSKGDWDKIINGKAEPNAVYKLDNGHAYVTDDKGRVMNVGGDLDGIKLDRNKHQQLLAGKEGYAETGQKYDGGHLIATQLGGAGDKINLVPMTVGVNRGPYLQMENTLAEALVAGKNVSVKIDVSYPTPDSVTPNFIRVTSFIDGVPDVHNFRQ
jgi:filamentous hemagglutinin